MACSLCVEICLQKARNGNMELYLVQLLKRNCGELILMVAEIFLPGFLLRVNGMGQNCTQSRKIFV